MIATWSQWAVRESPETPYLWEDGVMNKRKRSSPEVRERAVRMVLAHQSEYPSQWQAVVSIAADRDRVRGRLLVKFLSFE